MRLATSEPTPVEFFFAPRRLSRVDPRSAAHCSRVFGRALLRRRLQQLAPYVTELTIVASRVTRLIAVVTVVATLASAAAAAPEQVTLVARPGVALGGSRVTLSGSVDGGKAEEIVTIEAKDCGSSTQSFREVASARTEDGGSWSVDYYPGITTTLRAVWKDNTSAQVTVRQKAWIQLRRLPGSRREFEVSLGGKSHFWRKRALIQRFDRRLGTWTTVKSVVLTETGGFPGSGGVRTWEKFTASIPRRSQIRAMLPLSQARPCYLAGVSKLVGT